MTPRNSTPDISYIVSAYNRPHMLPVCLWSLMGQTHSNFEVIVTDNAIVPSIARQQKQHVEDLRNARFKYVNTSKKIDVSDCYRSAMYAIDNMARGSWLAFPCDDTYLVPEFGQRMLTAAHKNNWDFVYCRQLVVGPEASGGSGYRIWDMQPGRTIKTSFIVRASIFPEDGFGGLADIPAPVGADYFFSHRMKEAGVRMGYVDEVLIVHN